MVKIIENLSTLTPWNIEGMASADDHLLQGIRQQVKDDTIKEFGRKEIEAINQLIHDFGKPRVRRIGQGVWEKNTNPITKEGVLPKGFGLIEKDD